MKQKRSSVESRKNKGPTVQLFGARWSDASLSEVVKFERPGDKELGQTTQALALGLGASGR